MFKELRGLGVVVKELSNELRQLVRRKPARLSGDRVQGTSACVCVCLCVWSLSLPSPLVHIQARRCSTNIFIRVSTVETYLI